MVASVSGESVRYSVTYSLDRGYGTLGAVWLTPVWVQTRSGLMQVGEDGLVACSREGITLWSSEDVKSRRFPWEDVLALPADWAATPRERAVLAQTASEA